jgi:superfamily II DNA or RNA helicase
MAGIGTGTRVRWAAGHKRGYVQKIEGSTATVAFDDGTLQKFALSAGAISADPFSVGDHVVRATGGVVGVVLGTVPGGSEPLLKVAFASGQTVNLAARDLRPGAMTDPIERFKAGQVDPAEKANLRCVVADMSTRHLHDELVSLSHARVDLKPHQVSVVHRVVSSYPHRFLLCDEVGLGKTIEAAMIIKELRARRLARRVLILVPPGLARQWQFELKTKFNEVFAIVDGSTETHLKNQGVPNPWTYSDSIITSQTWASWDETRRSRIASVDWDLIVVDEAHHARRQRSGSRLVMTNLYRLVSELTGRPEASRRAVLFLTATPMQLQIHELYSLVELVNPTLFSSEEDFKSHIESRASLNQLVALIEQGQIPSGAALDPFLRQAAFHLGCPVAEARELLRSPLDLAERLRQRHRLSEVLIRNRRSIVGGFQPRNAFRWEVQSSEAEKEVQRRMDRILEEGYELAAQSGGNVAGFLMTIWQKLAASSSRALLRSLEARVAKLTGQSPGTSSSGAVTAGEAEEELSADATAASVAERVAPTLTDEPSKLRTVIQALREVKADSKATKLISSLGEIFSKDPQGRVLIFTEFRETQDYLAELIASHSWGCSVFHGQLSPLLKDEAVRRFQTGAGPQVLVSTEAGGEGRNFQFAHILVNYDLPWNPMRVEQRIGRVDRIGQSSPVVVFNFHVKGSIEGRILDVLERRIRLFTDSIGGLDPILGEAEADIRRALQRAPSERDAALEKVGTKLEGQVDAARRASEQLKDFVLDARSFSAQIAQIVQQQQASVSQSEFELMLVELLKSANTWVGKSTNSSEYAIQFHPPFTEECRDLIGDSERRRVCFDPNVAPDSEHIEYFGFGHPIVDALVNRVLESSADGSAAVRRIPVERLPGIRRGWQFVWKLTAAGIESRADVISLFVDDTGQLDRTLGEELLRISRRFQSERWADPSSAETIDQAHQIARAAFVRQREQLSADLEAKARERYEIQVDRTERLIQHRTTAARDRLTSSEGTLARLRASGDSLQRQAIPLWESNVARAQAEMEVLHEDRRRMLDDLNRARTPHLEDSLVCVARIET